MGLIRCSRLLENKGFCVLAWSKLLPSYFHAQKCEEIITEGLRLPSAEASVGIHENRTDHGIRRCRVRWAPPAGPFWGPLRNELARLLQRTNLDLFGFDVFPHLTDVQFTEYRGVPDQSDFYDWHEDIEWKSPNTRAHRKISLVVQLSNEATYEGGNLELRKDPPDAETLRRQGTIVIFPSFHAHRVSPLLAGARYSLVTWLPGPLFR